MEAIMLNKNIECCSNCKHCLSYPRNNSYGDVDHLCSVHGYFLHGIDKDRHTIERYSPGGKKLTCKYERI